MLKAITATWHTLTDTLTLVRRYRHYSLYPLLSYLIVLAVTYSLIIPLFERVLGPDRQGVLAWGVFGLVVYLAYSILTFVMGCGHVALVAGIATQLDGGDPGPTTAPLARTVRRLGLIGIYTVVSAGLGLVSILARLLINPLVGGVIVPVVGDKLWVRWRQLSYAIPLQLAVPIIALDRLPPLNIFQRGERLVKETWGERVKPAHSVNLLALLVLLPILIMFAMPTLRQGLAGYDHDLIRLGLSVTLVGIGTYIQISALVNTIVGLAAYRYATAGKGDVFPGDASYAEHVFVNYDIETGEVAAPATSPTDPPPVIAGDRSN